MRETKTRKEIEGGLIDPLIFLMVLMFMTLHITGNLYKKKKEYE